MPAVKLNTRDAENIPFRRVTATNERQRLRLHDDAPAGARDPLGDVLGGDVHHVRLTRRVEVGKMRIALAPAAARSGRSPCRGITRPCGACHGSVPVDPRVDPRH